jgi:hypothetical protein
MFPDTLRGIGIPKIQVDYSSESFGLFVDPADIVQKESS